MTLPRPTRGPTLALSALALLGAIILAMILFTTGDTPRAQAATFTVNSTGDAADIAVGDGICDSDPGAATVCTLRAAIQEAVSNGDTPDTISFSIPSSDPGCVAGVCTITLSSALPAITVDGTTISNATVGTVVVSGGGVGFSGIIIDGTGAFTPTGNIIRGLVFSGFTAASGSCPPLGAAVCIVGEGADANIVENNRIGTNATGTAAVPNSNGVIIAGGADNNIVRNNLISGNTVVGVAIDGASTTGNAVTGNLIGTDISGNTPLGNGGGVYLTAGASSNVIGGSRAGDACAAPCNVISGNSADGVNLAGASTSSNRVEGNYIGLGLNGVAIVGNGDDGVEDSSTSLNVIGGTTGTTAGACTGVCNKITHNGNNGVEVGGTATAIRRNSIFLNVAMGIDLAGPADGDTIDCPGDGPAVDPAHPATHGSTPTAQGGAFTTCPIIVAVTFSSGTFVVSGTDGGAAGPSAPTGSKVDVYIVQEDPAPIHGEGLTWVGTFDLAGDGTWGGSLCINGPTKITATITDTTTGRTTEYGPNKDVPSGTCAGATPTPTPSPTPSPTATPTPTGCDMTISKSDSPDPVLGGGLLTYSITVTNQGGTNCDSVTVTDTVPAGVTNIVASGCSINGSTVTCNFGTLTPSQLGVATITGNAPTTAQTLSNTATVSTITAEADTSNNSSTATTTVTAPATETVNLVSGCNPVSSTYPDNTPPATLGTNISPQRSDDAIWKYFPAENLFRGWARNAPPEAIDLAAVNFLDAIYICVSGDATFTRPVVSP